MGRGAPRGVTVIVLGVGINLSDAGQKESDPTIRVSMLRTKSASHPSDQTKRNTNKQALGQAVPFFNIRKAHLQ
jgi:hypothetical protein